jgi:RNA polymerase sigma-70 factor (ECF subfamily)
MAKLHVEPYRETEEGQPLTALSAPQVERLYREHNEVLLRFLRARLHNDADAHEAAQEAYVRLLQLDKPEQPSFLRAYLFKIAANVATDLLRRKGVRGVAVQPEDCVLAEPALQERDAAARQQLALVDRALNELPPKCREAFVLSRHEGWSSEQIAHRLGVSDRMVRLYLTRGLEHLRAALSRGFDGDVR